MISKLFHVWNLPFHKRWKTCQSEINGLLGGPSGKVMEERKLCTDDFLIRKPFVLYLGSLYLLSDNKHTWIPHEVPLLFLVAISVTEINGFFTICHLFFPFLCSLLSLSNSIHSIPSSMWPCVNFILGRGRLKWSGLSFTLKKIKFTK